MTTTQPYSLAWPDPAGPRLSLRVPASRGHPKLREATLFQGSAHSDAGCCPDWCDYKRTRSTRAPALYRGTDREMRTEGGRHVFARFETKLEAIQGHAPPSGSLCGTTRTSRARALGTATYWTLAVAEA